MSNKIWEYLIKYFSQHSEYPQSRIQEELSKLGKQGWELISIDNGRGYFKREITKKT